jgi:RNA polymerase sigma-70 factor (ECF subfamily)
LTGDRAEAEDLVQEALGRALERWDRISIMAEPVGYVYRIATNLYRKRWRNRRLVRPFLERVEGSAPDPAASVSAHADIVAALRRLPLEQRETVILVDLLGYDAAAAGAVLGIEPVSVRVRLHRARTALREWLGDGDD